MGPQLLPPAHEKLSLKPFQALPHTTSIYKCFTQRFLDVLTAHPFSQPRFYFSDCCLFRDDFSILKPVWATLIPSAQHGEVIKSSNSSFCPQKIGEKKNNPKGELGWQEQPSARCRRPPGTVPVPVCVPVLAVPVPVPSLIVSVPAVPSTKAMSLWPPCPQAPLKATAGATSGHRGRSGLAAQVTFPQLGAVTVTQSQNRAPATGGSEARRMETPSVPPAPRGQRCHQPLAAPQAGWQCHPSPR